MLFFSSRCYQKKDLPTYTKFNTRFSLNPPSPKKVLFDDQINYSEKARLEMLERSEKVCMQFGSKSEMDHSLLRIKSIDMQDPHLFDDRALPRLTSPCKQTKRMLGSVAQYRRHLSCPPAPDGNRPTPA